jgi:hypothetical protein
VQGLFFLSNRPFYRTPKLENAPQLVQALVSVWEEVLLALLLVGGAIGVLLTFGTANDTALLWCIALVIQAIPYFAALIAAVVSTAHRASEGSEGMIRLAE